ncbi:MAG: CotH kinase family protein [Flavobacteriales bacterium]|nr:CotH kinase family protein [Flavobacteriales bacterium]MCB9448380.1 CotH kinase family protein [Flavobacteriales bacterium]
MRRVSSLVLLVFFFLSSEAQTDLYDLNTLQKIEVFFSQPDWDLAMDTAKYGNEGYTMADSIRINGTLLDSVGVKYKGNSSYDSTYIKNPLHIELDTYKNQSYQGIKDIKLGNGYADPSMIREVLSYAVLGNYMDCPRSNFAELYINGRYIGVYSNDESINKQFLSSHFYSSSNAFVKCNPIVNPTPATKASLRYLSADSSQYFNFYELKSDFGWNELVNLCDTVTNVPNAIDNVLDIDRALWMLAFDNLLVNLDSYSGAFCQNYYIYKDATGRFNPIVWDLNMSFGGFAFAGSGNSSLGTLSPTNMQQLPLTLHATDTYWPLIKNLLAIPMYKRMYIAHARTIANEFFANSTYESMAAQMQTTIDASVQSDSNKFYSYSDFQNGMTADVANGSLTIPGIGNLMNARVTYLQSTTEFKAVPPGVTSIQASSSAPDLNSQVTITARVSGGTAVYLGYRHSLTDRFTRVEMYDDGAHNDGTAGDSIYGASFNMQSLQAQYYIYAENNDAGIFSPERAEHEFYTLTAHIDVSHPGDVTINEYLASNQSGEKDESGDREDWIELYNTTSSAVDLFGLYLSDDIENPKKFAFPQGTTIAPKDYLIIWADEDVSIPNYLHANFKLATEGEHLILSSVTGTIIDSLSYGPQQPDVSEGRCPNGTGPVVVLPYTSHGYSNCKTSSVEDLAAITFQCYPNPAGSTIRLNFEDGRDLRTIRIYNHLGEQVLEKTTGTSTETVDIRTLSNGIYFVRVNESRALKLVVMK